MYSESLWVAVSEEGWRPPNPSAELNFGIGAVLRQHPTPVLAEQFEQDILADLGNVVSNFIESGQVWALIIGFVLGYVLRGVTTYR